MKKEKGTLKRKLKAFFQKVKEFFKDLGADISNFMESTVKPAVEFLEVIKKVLENPSLDLFTAATKTDIDNKILEKLRKVLPIVIDKLGLFIVMSTTMTPPQQVQRYLKALRELSPEMRKAAYHKTASLLVQELSNKSYQAAEIDTLTQIAYNELKEEKNNA
jgi:hypothetical protein